MALSRSLRQLFAVIPRCSVSTQRCSVSTPRCSVSTKLAARCVTQWSSQPEHNLRENEAVNPNFVNRNPRNLELMCLAVKDRGWKTTWPHREFHHRLVFSRSIRYVTVEVFSCSSLVPVLSCSTKEWALKEDLASANCVAACQAVGEVLARRCKQAGITRMVFEAIPWTYRSDAVQSFRAAMKEGGVVFSEPRRKYIGT
ncbi:large ribosomal subunit protein uL18m isoform X2 [Nerophis lumbriciformis]|uniref:large ribosomal subunit protein uL18m isoform X2 n=1 Tax=Nerophis lumbriciformis TaxID=546530 RepID=UPI002AE05172|nr:large ribosomal subunit protein uL18m-like isoform X2 [Nerophis lumbriciformis]